MTALRRRWPKAVFKTLSRLAPEVERLRRGARNQSDRAFRHNAPGFCAVCDVRTDSALDVHMLTFHLELTQLWRCPVEWCTVWKGSVRACLEHLTEKHGGSTFCALKNVAKFFPSWTVTRSVWQAALQPDVSGIAVDARLFHEAGCRLVHRYRVYKDPFPHPALRGGVVPRLLSCVSRAMAIAQLTHLRISVPASGAPPGQVPADCYPGGAPQRKRPSPRRVSFVEDVTMLGDVSPSVCSPEQGTPTQLVSEFAEEDVIVPVGEPISSSAPAILPPPPPPPGFSPFSWPFDDGNMDNKQSCFPFDVDRSPDVLVGRPGVEPSLSPITPVRAEDSESVGSPEVGLLVSPLVDVSSDMTVDVSRPVSPLPSVESFLLQDMLWAPVAPQPPDVDDRRATQVPRWRLAREGSFLAERSPESIRSLGAGCAFRNTTYRNSDYAAPSGEYGLPMHHPQFLEWIGVPQSASVLEMGGGRWVNNLSRDQAMAAAVHLQRDIGLMQTNLDVLGQYTLSLQGTASKLIELCLGARDFPAEEVAAGALGPRVHRASVQMEAMGLWRPSLDPLWLH